ncbi:hypothetical protein IKS86_08825 [bacterium]|nr:hypothetical protein [bacterium]
MALFFGLVLMKNNYKRFENAVMPDNVPTADGKTYSIPQEWKAKQFFQKS